LTLKATLKKLQFSFLFLLAIESHIEED